MNSTFLKLILVTVIAVSIVSTSNSQEVYRDTLKIEEVIVTGTPVKINRNNLPLSVSVVTSQQINESSETSILPILSGRIPGLFVTERGVTGFGVATGSAGQISIRGIGGSPTTGVLMLIDGHPQFMGIMGHPLPDSYVSSDIERVEVIRGPGSVLYGTNALGGAINLITKKQTNEGFNSNIRLMYGSYNTQKYMGSAGYKKDKLSLFASVNHNSTDGHRSNSFFKITNGYTKITYDINKHISLNTDFSLAAFEASDPGPDTLKAKVGQTIDISRGYGAFSIENKFDKISGSAKLFYNFGEHDITDGFHSIDHNYGLNIVESLKLFKGNTISLGFDYMNYGGIAENLKAMGGKGIVFADTTVTETSFYGLIQQTLANNISLNAGLRFFKNNISGTEILPTLGISWTANDNTTFKTSYSKGFRSPTIRELFLWGPNPALKPESINNYEAAIFKSYFDSKLKLELTAFAIDGDNLIITVPLKGLQNAGAVNNKGIEFTADASLLKNLSTHLAYSFIKMKTPVYATPEHQLFISCTYKLGANTFNLNLQQVNNLDTDPTPKTTKQNYTLVNAKVNRRLCNYADFFISAENILNQKYEQNRYYPMPGTTLFAGINLKI